MLQGTDDSFINLTAGNLSGFEFTFFGTTDTSLFIRSNGLISFGSGNASFSNTDLTTAPTQAAIAPLWDDLELFSDPASALCWEVRGTGANQRLIIPWEVNYFAFNDDLITFQAILHECDGTIAFHDLDLQGSSFANEGASATVGIKNAGAQGPERLLLGFDNGPNAFVGSGQSTRIQLVNDVDLYRFTLHGGELLWAQTSTPATGPESYGNGLDPQLRLLDAAGNLVASNDNVVPGRDARLVFQAPLISGGVYDLEVRSSLASGSPTAGEYFLSVYTSMPDVGPVTLGRLPGEGGKGGSPVVLAALPDTAAARAAAGRNATDVAATLPRFGGTLLATEDVATSNPITLSNSADSLAVRNAVFVELTSVKEEAALVAEGDRVAGYPGRLGAARVDEADAWWLEPEGFESSGTAAGPAGRPRRFVGKHGGDDIRSGATA